MSQQEMSINENAFSAEDEQARKELQRLLDLLEEDENEGMFFEDDNGNEIDVPPSIYTALKRIIQFQIQGKAVMIVPMSADDLKKYEQHNLYIQLVEGLL